MWYINIMEYNLEIKRNKLQIYMITWTDLKGIMSRKS